jgi:hypothetical protein
MSDAQAPRPGARLLAAWIVALQLVALVASSRLEVSPSAASEVGSVELAAQVPADLAAVPAVVPAPASTTSTVAPPPPPPAPPDPPATAASATVTPVPPPAPPPPSRRARVEEAFVTSIPAGWRAAIPVRLVVIPGQTSWAVPGGEIRVAATHADASMPKLRAVLAHEFGHLIAFRYGAQTYNGAAPKGWPAYGARPEEAWADCVSQAATGVLDPSYGQPPCGGASLSWTRQWLAAGPSAHPVTGR